MGKKLKYGVGINDVDYVPTKFEYLEERLPSGKKKKRVIWQCPYHNRWCKLIERCYSEKALRKQQAYRMCHVCEEWLTFSNFRKWMVTQDWEGKHLDKDLLVEGNKVYSPETCMFIHPKINTFLNNQNRKRGEYLIGCCWKERDKKLAGQCCNTFTGKVGHLGYFDTELEAHLAWKHQKHQYACQLAESQYVADDRVAECLRTKYKNYTIVEDHLK